MASLPKLHHPHQIVTEVKNAFASWIGLKVSEEDTDYILLACGKFALTSKSLLRDEASAKLHLLLDAGLIKAISHRAATISSNHEIKQSAHGNTKTLELAVVIALLALYVPNGFKSWGKRLVASLKSGS